MILFFNNKAKIEISTADENSKNSILPTTNLRLVDKCERVTTVKKISLISQIFCKIVIFKDAMRYKEYFGSFKKEILCSLTVL